MLTLTPQTTPTDRQVYQSHGVFGCTFSFALIFIHVGSNILIDSGKQNTWNREKTSEHNVLKLGFQDVIFLILSLASRMEQYPPVPYRSTSPIFGQDSGEDLQ